jgi:hypothetical protein
MRFCPSSSSASIPNKGCGSVLPVAAKVLFKSFNTEHLGRHSDCIPSICKRDTRRTAIRLPDPTWLYYMVMHVRAARSQGR